MRGSSSDLSESVSSAEDLDVHFSPSSSNRELDFTRKLLFELSFGSHLLSLNILKKSKIYTTSNNDCHNKCHLISYVTKICKDTDASSCTFGRHSSDFELNKLLKLRMSFLLNILSTGLCS